MTTLEIGKSSFANATTAVLSLLPNATKISFDEGSLNSVKTLHVTGVGMGNKTVIEISNNTLTNVEIIAIGDDSDKLLADSVIEHITQTTPATNITVSTDVILPTDNIVISNCSQLASVAGDIRRLVFDDEACNLPSDTLLDLTRFVYLRNITVGMNALQHVTSVNAAGLRNLQLFEVGAGSLMNAANFTITDASKLLWDVEVNSYSVLMSMPTLVTSIIITANTGNQAGITALDLTRFVQVERIEIMENSFSFVQTVIATPMPSLTELFIHRGSLKNANMNNMIAGTIAVTWVYEAVNEEDFNQAPAEITHLIVPDNTCNDPSFTILDILTYEHLVSFVVGTNALMNVVTVMEESDKGHLIDEVLVGEYSLMNVNKT